MQYSVDGFMSKRFPNLELADDGIYGQFRGSLLQEVEILLRDKVAKRNYCNYFSEIAKHHSIPVMQKEVESFVHDLPNGALICDVGGCWGWHWLEVVNQRPDLKIIIVDFVRANLDHAKVILGKSINKNVFLVHGDALNLDFPDAVFDAYWTVQTTQHIPLLREVYLEAHRILKPGGKFSDYVLNDTLMARFVAWIAGRDYVTNGQVEGRFYLRRSGQGEFQTLKQVFGIKPSVRYSEMLFSPEFGFSLGGKKNSFLGYLDFLLSRYFPYLKFIARQQSLHVWKK